MRTWNGGVGAGLTPSNLARVFTPTRPMYAPGTDPRVFRVKGDIPIPLKEALADNLKPIGPDCLRSNAKVCLEVYEDICLKHVLGKQLNSKDLRRLMQMDPRLQQTDEYQEGVTTRCVARSSLLGRDPWGDGKLPQPKKRSSDGDSEGADGDEDAEGDNAMYTSEQLLLIDIQNTNYQYLTAHVGLILDATLHNKVVHVAMEYERDEDGKRSNSNRNRMPWRVYKQIILEDLDDELELWVLLQLLSLMRENGDSVKRWIQRMGIGKSLVEKEKIVLPDKVYVLKTLLNLTKQEMELLVKGVQRKALNPKSAAQQKKHLSISQARRELRNTKWPQMLPLAEESIDEAGQPPFRLQDSMLKNEAAVYSLKAAFKIFQRLGFNAAKKLIKGPAGKKQDAKKKICGSCLHAGLKGKDIEHDESSCNPKLQKRNLKRMRKAKKERRNKRREERDDRRRRKRKRGDSDKRKRDRADGNDKPICQLCKKAGRKFRHPEKDCKHAPGGMWHGLDKEQLRAAQKEYYRMKRQQDPNKMAQTNQAEERPASKKARRRKVKRGRKKLREIPYWQKAETLMMEARPKTTGAKTPEKDGQYGRFKETKPKNNDKMKTCFNTIGSDTEEEDFIGAKTVTGKLHPRGVEAGEEPSRPTPRVKSQLGDILEERRAGMESQPATIDLTVKDSGEEPPEENNWQDWSQFQEPKVRRWKHHTVRELMLASIY